MRAHSNDIHNFTIQMKQYPATPSIRVRPLTSYDARTKGDYVVYWMNAFRRPRFNFALQHAISKSLEFNRPLVIVEALRCGYRWASDRFHRFVIDGMIDNAKYFADKPVTYYPFLETNENSGHGFIETLSKNACQLIADDFPCFFHPILYRRIVSKWPVPVELVDSNGLLPMRIADRTFTVAHSFRRYLQKELPNHLGEFPLADPLHGVHLQKLDNLPNELLKRWPVAKLSDYEHSTTNFDRFNIDHSIPTVDVKGGHEAARIQMNRFIAKHLDRYDEDRNVPDLQGASRLSPYLHFGHVSAHEVFSEAMHHADWKISNLKKPNGKAQGYWGATPQVEGFIDELITWREIGFNMCHREPDYDKYESLPSWAQTTLKEHEKDKRVHIYSFEELEHAKTSDLYGTQHKTS